MTRSPAALVTVLLMAACAAPRLAESPPSASSVAVQSGDLPNTMHRCAISGDINAYLDSLKAKDPTTYKSTKAQWTDAQSRGATAAQVVFYTDSDANCASVASTVANISGAAYPLLVNFTIQFKDESSAAGGYTSGKIFGIDRAMLKADSVPVVEGTKTGLGSNSIVLSTTIIGQSFYIAVWQNKAFMVILGLINLDSATGQKVAASENKRIR